MIKLHQYPPVWGLPSLSPFCIKVEYYLRRHKIAYQVIVETNPARGPKGRMPFISDGDTVIADSSLILDYLKSPKNGKDGKHDRGHFQDHLQADLLQESLGLAYQRLIEENLYFVLLYSRWVDPGGFKVVRKDFAKLFPPLVGKPILHLLRAQLRRQALEQGMGCHSLAEVYEIGKKDLSALAALLGEKRYFLGDQPSDLDATAYSFLVTFLKQPIENPLQELILKKRNLLEFCNREEGSIFPEWS